MQSTNEEKGKKTATEPNCKLKWKKALFGYFGVLSINSSGSLQIDIEKGKKQIKTESFSFIPFDAVAKNLIKMGN